MRAQHHRRVLHALIAGALGLTLLTVTPGVADADHSPCQQSSHVWIATDPDVGILGPSRGTSAPPGNEFLRVSSNTDLFMTGVVARGTQIRFRFVNLTTGAVVSHHTNNADGNCVVRHEHERRSAGNVANGRVRVDITYIPWELDFPFSETLGVLEVVPASGGPGGGGDDGGGCQPGVICEISQAS